MPLASNNLHRRQLHPACARPELALITWHTLRHTHGTLLHELGTPLRVAQAELGHSHMTTTLEVHMRASASGQRHAVDQLGNQQFSNVPEFAQIGQRSN
jgi:integrase